MTRSSARTQRLLLEALQLLVRIGLSAFLDEKGQYGAALGSRKRRPELLMTCRRRNLLRKGRELLEVENYDTRSCRIEPPQQPGMDIKRPRPRAQLADAVGVYAYNDDLLGRGALSAQLVAEAVQPAVHPLQHPREEHEHQAHQHHHRNDNAQSQLFRNVQFRRPLVTLSLDLQQWPSPRKKPRAIPSRRTHPSRRRPCPCRQRAA